MEFTEAEIRFLCEEHQCFIEHANSNRTTMHAELRGLRDLRKMGCPERVFFSMLKERTRKLGHVFDEFRAQQRGEHAEDTDEARRQKMKLLVAEIAG